MTLIVSKFGGSSVGNAERIARCVRLFLHNPHRKVAVISATQHTTNQLEEIGHLAESSTESSTENPSLAPSMASTIASLPALVLKILKLAFIARVESFSILKVLPILLVASCSKFRNTSLGSIEFSAKITFPVEALANSEKATIRPLIVRLESSAAVIARFLYHRLTITESFLF